MILASLKLQFFKNYESENVAFSPGLNCLVGLNGSGKTNLLDAIHYLSFTKSAFTATDPQNIKNKEQYFRIEGIFDPGEERKISVLCFVEKGQKKVFKANSAEYDRLSDHIGKIHVVLQTPYDTEIIRDGSEYRRKWVDGCIAQYDHQYLENLLRYQKVMKHRNALLKNADGKLSNSLLPLLDTYDEEIIRLSLNLTKERASFIDEIQQYFTNNIQAIVEGAETCKITYKAQALDDAFAENFRQARQKDVLMQRTTIGAHRDDYVFELNGHPIKRFGSQGQQKSFLIALRLTQYDDLRAKTGAQPILLLDDVFDKLDDDRIGRLLALLSDSDRFGQIFITDARKERAMTIFGDIGEKKMFEVNKGTISEL
jgi:DNA replication and repair protein RecF